jgi:Flp pilus assembly protein TadB
MADGSQKYEREIAEILERMEREEPRAERTKRQARQAAEQRKQTVQRGFSDLRNLSRQAGQYGGWMWIGLTIGMGVLGLVLRSVLPILGVVCAVLMVLLFLSPLIMRFSGPEGSQQKYWRGNVIDYRPRGGLGATIRHWWWRFRSRR